MRKCIVVEIEFLDENQDVYVEFEVYNKQVVVYDIYLVKKQVDIGEIYYLHDGTPVVGPVYISTVLHGGPSNLELLTRYQINIIKDLVEENIDESFSHPNQMGTMIGIKRIGE